MGDVSLGIFGLTQQDLGRADSVVGVSEIAIQFQRPLAFSDAESGPIGAHLNHALTEVGDCVVGRQKQRSGYSGFGGGKPLGPVFRQESDREYCVQGGDLFKGPKIVGIQRQGALEEVASRGKGARGDAFEVPSETLEVKVHRIGIGLSPCADRCGSSKLCIECLGETRNNLVLRVKQVGQRLIKSFGPKMRPSAGLY